MIAYVRLIDDSNASVVSIFISAAEFLVILASLRKRMGERSSLDSISSFSATSVSRHRSLATQTRPVE